MTWDMSPKGALLKHNGYVAWVRTDGEAAIFHGSDPVKRIFADDMASAQKQVEDYLRERVEGAGE